MPVFVDGHNLAYVAEPTRRLMIRGEVDGARRALCALIAGAPRADQVVVFVDGGPRGTSRIRGVRVEYTGPGESADDRIVAAITHSADPAAVTVVSSDRELRRRCQAAGAGVMGCKKFLSTVLTARRRTANAGGVETEAPEKPQGPLSQREIDAWVEYFGLEGGDGE